MSSIYRDNLKKIETLIGYKRIFDPEKDEAQDSKYLKKAQDIYSLQLELFEGTTSIINTTSFCFFREFDLNALSNCVDGHGVIGITAGTPLLLKDIFNSLLSHPKFLAKDLNATDEKAYFNYLTMPNSSSDYLIDGEYLRVPRYSPINPSRGRYAGILSDLSLDFLFLHELAHLIGGHILFRKNALHIFQEIAAFSKYKVKKEHAISCHALEYDADWFAVQALILTGMENKGIIGSLDNIAKNPTFLFRTIILSIVILMICGIKKEISLEQAPVMFHPHPYWRLFLLYMAGNRVVSYNFPEMEDNWKKAFYQALVDLRYASIIFEPANKFFRDEKSIIPGFRSKIMSILDRHNDLIHELEQIGSNIRNGFNLNKYKK